MIRIGRRGLSALGGAGVLLLGSAGDLSAQAYRVKDINPGNADGVHIFANEASDDDILAIGSTVYFGARDGTHGEELWRTDGTAAGTVLVKDINPGPNSSSPRDLAGVGSVLFFRADDGVNGYELWKSDGTAAGTVLVKDISPGPSSSFNAPLHPSGEGRSTAVGSLLFFVANDGVHGHELWRSDGTAAGTDLVKDVGRYSNVRYLRPFAGALYFSVNTDQTTTGNGGLWKSDGTEAGTTPVRPFAGEQPSYLTEFNGTLYFAADDGASGLELWKSDGTTAGTILVKDINPGAGGSITAPPQSVNGRLFFSAWPSGAVWISDGTEAGTELLKVLRVGSFNKFVGLAGLTFFAADDSIHGTELWRTDGTAAGTVLLKDIRPGSSESMDGLSLRTLTSENCALYLLAAGDGGPELWTSDGTSAGTVMFQDIAPLGLGSTATPLVRAGRLLYLNADDGTSGRELWALDVVNECPVVSSAAVSSTVSEAVGTHTVGVKVTTPAGGPTTRSVSVSYATVGGTALASADYVAASGTLTFPAGSASGSTLPVALTILNDALDEDSETFLLQLSSPTGGTLGTLTTHTVIMADDDPSPAIGIDDVSVAEGNAGTTLAGFTVSLSAPSGRVVAVGYATADGTASAGADYAGNTATLVVPAGSAEQTVAVAVIGDRVYEGDETFTVNLSSPLNATLADAEGLGTIMDDDPQGLSIADLAIVEPISRSRTVSFTVTLSPTSSGTVTVEYSTTGVSATSGSDFEPASGILTFDAGVSTLPVEVPVHADVLIEGVETLQVNLANAGGAAVAYGQAIGSIHDPGNFFTLLPCRVLDTRNPPGPFGGPALEAGESRVVAVAGSCGIPPSARAVSLNVTVTQPTALGNLRLYPADAELPLVSSLNYSAGQTRGNNSVVGLSARGALAIRCDQAAGTAHAIVDVNGYFE